MSLILDKKDKSIVSSSEVLLELNNPSQSKSIKIVSDIRLIPNQIPSVHLADETPNLVPNIRLSK